MASFDTDAFRDGTTRTLSEARFERFKDRFVSRHGTSTAKWPVQSSAASAICEADAFTGMSFASARYERVTIREREIFKVALM